MPTITLSCAVSSDGFLDDISDQRAILSSEEDLSAILSLRAQSDMIVIGAETMRRDNPSLATRGDTYFKIRKAAGRAPHPVKVVISRSGHVPNTSKFFTDGNSEKIVLKEDFGDADALVDTLFELARMRGLNDILIEGGATLLHQVIATGRADQWRLAISDHILGERGYAFLAAPQTLLKTYPVRESANLGGTQVHWLDLRVHRLSELMTQAFDLSAQCPPSKTAFSVGAIACDASLKVLSTGFSRETGAKDHAEEALLAKLDGPVHTVFCTLEPCLTRASKPTGCAQRLVKAGVKRVIYAVAEDGTFTDQAGLKYLREHGVALIHLPGFEARFRQVNAALYR